MHFNWLLMPGSKGTPCCGHDVSLCGYAILSADLEGKGEEGPASQVAAGRLLLTLLSPWGPVVFRTFSLSLKTVLGIWVAKASLEPRHF